MSVILPVVATANENTLPYKDWLRACGIEDVATEDDSVREWERRLRMAFKLGKKTPNHLLHKKFPEYVFLKQIDVQRDSGRSSDITLQLMQLRGRELVRWCTPIAIGEHAVKRYREHTGRRPDILDWVCYQPFDENTTELSSPQGLLCGSACYSQNNMETYNIDTKQFSYTPALVFLIKTVIPVEIMNENQRYRWYKLQQAKQLDAVA